MGRPNHPDFAILSAVLQAQDTQVDADSKSAAMLNHVQRDIDFETMEYAATQRAQMSINAFGNPPQSLLPVLAAMWMDGFMAGARFRAAKQEQRGEVTESIKAALRDRGFSEHQIAAVLGDDQ